MKIFEFARDYKFELLKEAEKFIEILHENIMPKFGRDYYVDINGPDKNIIVIPIHDAESAQEILMVEMHNFENIYK